MSGVRTGMPASEEGYPLIVIHGFEEQSSVYRNSAIFPEAYSVGDVYQAASGLSGSGGEYSMNTHGIFGSSRGEEGVVELEVSGYHQIPRRQVSSSIFYSYSECRPTFGGFDDPVSQDRAKKFRMARPLHTLMPTKKRETGASYGKSRGVEFWVS
jgi:hypothetical protein